MNKAVTSLISIFLSLVIGYLLYDNMVLANEARLSYLKNVEEVQVLSGYSSLTAKNEELKNLNLRLEANPNAKNLYVRNILTTGVFESNIVTKLLNEQPKKDDKRQIYFKINEYKADSTYFIDAEDESPFYQQDTGLEFKDGLSAEEEKGRHRKELEAKLKEIDASGNLIGAEVDDGTWRGVEILPIALKFEGTYKGFMIYLSKLETFPYHFIRSLDTVFIDENNIKGTLILSFPLSDKRL